MRPRSRRSGAVAVPRRRRAPRSVWNSRSGTHSRDGLPLPVGILPARARAVTRVAPGRGEGLLADRAGKRERVTAWHLIVTKAVTSECSLEGEGIPPRRSAIYPV